MKSNLTSLMKLYIHGKTSEKQKMNVDMFLEAMRENGINSFPDDKDDLIFTILCCDDLSRDRLREFVNEHGKYVPITHATFDALWARLWSGGES